MRIRKPQIRIRTAIAAALCFITAITGTYSCGRQSAESTEEGGIKKRNEIVREYLSAERILWTSGEGIENPECLLKPGNGQADLVGADLCVLKGNADNPPSILLDFGTELHGGIEIVSGMFRGKEPIRVRITLGESVAEAMSEVTHYTGGQLDPNTATNDHAMRDFELLVPWLGKIEIGNSGFRFARITLLDNERTLLMKEFRAISIYRDIPWLGSFMCNDERLNEIWATGARTVHLNMQEYLWDGIKRDRLVWVGDMHPEVMTILSVFGYNEVVPKSMDFIRDITELPAWMNGISSYSMWWILIHYRWYMNTGDIEYLKENSDYIFRLLDALKSKIAEDGSEQLDGMRFLDWPSSPNKEAIHAGLQSLMILSFGAGADIATFLGEEELAKEYTDARQLLLRHVPDPNGNKSGAALMAMAQLKDASEINNGLLSLDPFRGISSFYGYYVLQARAMAGDYQGAMEVIRKYWGGMLDLGASTFWEDFNLEWSENAGRIDELPVPGKKDIHRDFGDYCYRGYRHSLCHGWAGGPTAWLSQHVLGIKILEPGCKKIMIIPQLGDLQWAEGSYPTPMGVIQVRHEKKANGSIKSDISVPEGIRIIEP